MFLKNLFIYIIFFIPSVLIAKEIKVCPTCPISKLQNAIEKADSGDKIILMKGTYNEHDILINKSIHIQGEGLPSIDVKKIGYGLIIKANNVTISGIKIENVAQSYTKDYAAIYVSRCKYINISNIELSNVFFGILVEKSNYGVITNNKISSNAKTEASSGNGIHLWHCNHFVISKNNLSGLRDGIYFEFVSETKILENTSHNNLRYGLHFMFSNNNEYHYNVFTNNGAGVAVMFSKFINMTHNKFTKNWGSASYGLLLKEIYDSKIENNLFEENTIAINADGVTRITFQKNNFKSNGWALKISGASYTNVFKNNNFLNNSFDVSYNGKIHDNIFDSNYWSEYAGYDLDKNGIGDIPYRPVKLFSYVVNKSPESILLLRSFFIDIINFSEKVSPVFTPDNLMDSKPLMHQVK